VTPPPRRRQRREFLVIFSWQISTDFLHLRPDHVVVVAEPLLSGGVGTLDGTFLKQRLIDLLEAVGISLETLEQRLPGPLASRHTMFCRNFARMGFELFQGKRGLDAWKVIDIGMVGRCLDVRDGCP
jgi:hypothetical protein